VRVAVLGTITSMKGSGLLQLCALDAARREQPLEFVVLGRTDRDAALVRTRRVAVTGPFREDEIYERLRISRCHLALLPSIVPETYMYTLSTAMTAGLFTVCLDLGAQAQRIRASGAGLVLPLDASPGAINDALLEAARSLADYPVHPPRSMYAIGSDLLESYYGFTEEERRRLGLPAPAAARMPAQLHLVRRNAHACLH
jgi:hypothetical protein